MTNGLVFAVLHSGSSGKCQEHRGFTVARTEDKGTLRLLLQWDKPDSCPGPVSLSFKHVWVTYQCYLLPY